MPRQPGSFACQSQDSDSQPAFPVRRLPAALRIAANDPHSCYPSEARSTYDFNAGVQLDIEASQSKEHIQETTSVASTVTGDNIYIQTGVGRDDWQGCTSVAQI